MEGNELYNSEEEPGNWSGNKASELCRVCACPNTYLIPIFEGEGLENELAMKIQKHLPIQVLELDGLPNHMCYQCASTLIAWHDLAMGCVEADNKLREWQREEQLQLQDNGEDKDDKSSEFYDTPSLESELPDIDTTKSKEPDLSTPEMQTKTLKKKIVITKVKERPSERSTIKMTIAKNPTAGPSGYTSKPQVVEELKTLEGSTQEFGVTKSEYGKTSPELNSVYQASFLGLFIGGCYGGFVRSRHAYLDFMERNQATTFTSHLEAKKKLQDQVTVNFGKGAFQWGWRLGLFSGSYVLITTAISIYRGKSSMWEYIAAGGVTGACYKTNLGLRGMVVGGLLGSALGCVGGAVSLALLKATGMSMEEMRFWQYRWKEARVKQNMNIINSYRAEEEDPLIKNHNEKVGAAQNILNTTEGS